MSPRTLSASLAVLALTAAPVAAQQGSGDASDKQRIAELEGQVSQLLSAFQEMSAEAEAMRQALAGLSGDMTNAGDEFYIPRAAAEFDETDLMPSLGNIYTKPYLAELGSNTYVGGYIDLEYTDPKGSSPTSKEFDQHRLVPFIYSDVDENVKVMAEIEYEHGHELEVEFAQMDFVINDGVNLRGGILLMPLGKLNEVHDSPIQDLTLRPLVNRYIIPTTLRDAGVGLWGNIGDQVSYNVAVTNGFRGLDAAGNSAIDNSTGLRGAAPQSDTLDDPFSNTNDKLAYTGRVAYKPVLGVEIGGSAHYDHYDERGDNRLRILALDATIDGAAVPFLPDNMEILAEGATADVQRDFFAKSNGVAGDMTGSYVQANWHFAPDCLQSLVDDGLIQDGSHFTFVLRHGAVDLDDYVMRRNTIGLNFRPNESNTVFKLDYQMNSDHGANQGTNDSDALLASIASYF